MALRGIPPTLWPIHVRPEQDELLSSWMVRFAHAHGMRAESLVTVIFGARSSVWNRDIDRSIPAAMLNLLSEASAVPVEILESCKLTNLAGTLSETVNVAGNSRWILPLGVYHRKRTRCSLMYCSECLRSDDTPHYRKQWRLSVITECLVHRTQLLDYCPFCMKEVVPHRVDMRWRAQTSVGSSLHVLCYNCGSDLRKVKMASASPEDVAAGELVSHALKLGWVELGDSPIHSLAFFDGLTALIQGVAGLKGGAGIDVIPLTERRRLLREASALLVAWPNEFLRVAAEKKWSTTSLQPSRKQLPYWLHQVVKWNLDKWRAPISQEEATAIVDQTVEYGRPKSFVRARSVSGRMVEQRHLPPGHDKRIDNEVFETLLAHIDHRIAHTFNKTERAHFLADKVMLALARVHGFSQERIAKLTLDDASHLANGRRPSFESAPITKLAVGAWVGWYLKSVRPQLLCGVESKHLFVSKFKGRPLSANGIGARFTGYCKEAFLHLQIADYRSMAGTHMRSKK